MLRVGVTVYQEREGVGWEPATELQQILVRKGVIATAGNVTVIKQVPGRVLDQESDGHIIRLKTPTLPIREFVTLEGPDTELAVKPRKGPRLLFVNGPGPRHFVG